MSTVVKIEARRRRDEPPAPVGTSIDAHRIVDGCRSPYFNALKRRVRIVDEDLRGYRVELGELRAAVIPWIRLPVFHYWRHARVHTLRIDSAETIARTFLETGHVPAARYL